MVSVFSEDKIRRTYTDQSFYPSIIAGWAFEFAPSFDLFLEGKFGYGKTDAGPEQIPISGFSFSLGMTMYLTDI